LPGVDSHPTAHLMASEASGSLNNNIQVELVTAQKGYNTSTEFHITEVIKTANTNMVSLSSRQSSGQTFVQQVHVGQSTTHSQSCV